MKEKRKIKEDSEMMQWKKFDRFSEYFIDESNKNPMYASARSISREAETEQ